MALWSDKEVALLIDCYDKRLDAAEMVKIFDGKRSEAAIRNKARILKLTHNESWQDNEIKILKDSYENGISVKEIYELLNKKRSIGSIRGKAQQLKLFKHNKWTTEEENILKKYYENTYFYNIQKMLPRHSRGSITWKADKLGLEPFIYWNESEELYIKNNWQFEPDIILANHLNRTERAIRAKRITLGLLRKNRDTINVKYLSNYFRVHINDWKKESMKQCNYQCIFTGSKDFEIHHLYSMHFIVEETLTELGYDKNNIYTENYTDKELKNLLIKFISIHSKYPLGICISPKIHQLYHKLYGTNNFPEQWERFKNDYINGVYNSFLLTSDNRLEVDYE